MCWTNEFTNLPHKDPSKTLVRSDKGSPWCGLILDHFSSGHYSSDPNSASASHTGSAKSGYFSESALINHLLDGCECFCLLCLKLNLKKKEILTASARDNSVTGFPVVFFTCISIFQHERVINTSSRNASQFKCKQLSKLPLLVLKCLS